MKTVTIEAAKNTTVSKTTKAWDQLVQAITVLTQVGVIRWRQDSDDLRADLSLLLVEDDDHNGNTVHALRVWNTPDEGEDADEVTSYDSTGDDVERLFEVAFAHP
jgi:hypothetical protein